MEEQFLMEEGFRECFRIYQLLDAAQSLTFKTPYLLEGTLRILRIVDADPEGLTQSPLVACTFGACADFSDEKLLWT
jgi:hypothetical protein